MKTLITIQPCLLGWSVIPHGHGAERLYVSFGQVLWFLLNFRGDYKVVLK